MIDIKNYEGLYAVTEDGKVWSYRRKKFLSPSHINGYRGVLLGYKGIKKCFYIHRLVAEAFIPNPNGYTEINHIDENKDNNSVSNLEWCSRKYNIDYGARNELIGLAHRKAVYCVELNKVFNSIKEAKAFTGVQNISICCKGKINTAGGYHWKYCEE